MRSIRNAPWISLSLAFCAAIPCVFGAQDSEPELPSWALGVAGFKDLGPSLDRFARFCDRVAENSGAVARQGITSRFFALPIDEGIEAKSPAVVIWLDPALAGGPDERALVLPVSDAKAFKEALVATFGSSEKNGIQKLVLPQGFDLPEKELLVRVDGKVAFAAPNEACLKKLQEAFASKGIGAFVNTAASDFSIAFNLTSLRKTHREDLELRVAWAAALGEALWPQAAAEFQSVKQAVLDRSRDLDRVEMRMDIGEDSATLTARVRALPETDLGQVWDRRLPARESLAARVVSQTSAFSMDFRAPIGATEPAKIGEAFAKLFAPPTDTLKQAQARLGEALAALDAATEGGFSVALSSAKEAGPQILLAIGARDPPQAEHAVEAALRAAAATAQACLRIELALKDEAPAPLTLKDLSPTIHEGTNLKGFRVELGEGVPIPAEIRAAWERALGWPPAVRFARVEGGVILAAGKDGESALKAAIDRSKSAKTVDSAGGGVLPESCILRTTVRPVGLVEALLKGVTTLGAADVSEIVEGLEDAPLDLRVDRGAGAASLKVRTPAAAFRVLARVFFRLRKKGIDPGMLLGFGAGEAPQDAPTPPPPEK